MYSSTEEYELLAEEFALELLMPERIFKQMFREVRKLVDLDSTIEILSDHFMVPENIVAKRARRLSCE